MKKRVTAKRNLSMKRGMARLCIFFMLSLVGCSPHYLLSATDGEYDNTHIHTKDIHRVLGDVVKSIYRVETSTTFNIGDEKSTLKAVDGNSDDFKIVSQVILPANFQTGLSIRLGYITQLDFVRYGPNGEVAARNDNIFGISAVVSEGDSGSPILLIRDGKVESGGLVSFIVLPARGLGYGLKINPILEKLKAEKNQKAWLEPLLK